MKTLFIEAKYKGKVKLPIKLVKQLPKTIGLFAAVQFIDSLKDIKKQLEKSDKRVKLFKTKHTKYPGQLLGCSIEQFSGVDAFLYIGDGLFHPKALVMKNNKPVYVYNPLNKSVKTITRRDIDRLLKKQKGAYLRFLESKEIGVLISIKPGQNQLKRALKLKEAYPDKNFYFLVFDTVDFSQLENFPFIECFINTACPRIGLDDSSKIKKPILNIGDIHS
ncbi:diphthamide synthesis protein [Candidatus Woesearchaeota archaeon]|nr:diphthamide synthesis protein [Candidatus Woesearchaeota archaeon]